MRHRFKMLPLDFRVNEQYGPTLEEYFERKEEIIPLFGRDGWYFDRKKKMAWKEAGGRAWKDDRLDDFLYKFLLLDHRRLDAVERQAIRTLMNRNRCPQELREAYWVEQQVRDFRRLKVDMHLRVLKYEKEFPRD